MNRILISLVFAILLILSLGKQIPTHINVGLSHLVIKRNHTKENTKNNTKCSTVISNNINNKNIIHNINNKNNKDNRNINTHANIDNTNIKRFAFIPDGIKNAIASGLATAVVKTLLQPLDTIKTIQQSSKIKLGPLKAALQVIESRGM